MNKFLMAFIALNLVSTINAKNLDNNDRISKTNAIELAEELFKKEKTKNSIAGQIEGMTFKDFRAAIQDGSLKSLGNIHKPRKKQDMISKYQSTHEAKPENMNIDHVSLVGQKLV